MELNLDHAAKIKVLGIPYDHNSSYLRGPSLAPDRIRMMEKEGSANAFCEFGVEILNGVNYTDIGNIHFEDINPHEAYLSIKKRVENEISLGVKLLSLGGDHSVSYPIIEAHTKVYPGLHVIHIDAHTDIYEHFDNNPYSHASPFARLCEQNMIASLTQIGIRSATKHHHDQAIKYGIKMIEMKDFNYDFLSSLSSPLYISLDIDALDPAFAPGVSHHEPGGFSTRDVLNIIQKISVPIIGADIVEYNPIKDIHHMTAMVGYKMLKELIYKMMD